MAAGTTPFSRLSRALAGTKMVILWEQILPAVVPFAIWAGVIAVAGQWGLFNTVSGYTHAGVLASTLAIAGVGSVHFARKIKSPDFTAINTRLALDNGLRPEQLLAMRHVVNQPRLKVGKAKAGIAIGDPFALRFAIVLMAAFGLISQGPVPIERVTHAFVPAIEAPLTTLASLELPKLR